MSAVPSRSHPPRRRFWRAPSTVAGRRAAWLSLAPPGLTVVTAPLAAAGAYDWSRGVRLVVLGVPALAALACALAAGALAVAALRRGDRSPVLAWPLLAGALAVLLVVGELAFPH